jgi:hypothetical protein
VTPREIEARLDALRDAGRGLRRRPARETLDGLCRVLDGWSDPDSSWRKQLALALPSAAGFSPENVREGLARGLAGWNGASLRALVESEIGSAAIDGGGARGAADRDAGGMRIASGFGVTSLVLAGSIPMPTLLALVAPLALRSPVLARCAARDPVTAPLVARSVAEVDAKLGACVDVVTFPSSDAASMSALLGADCVVATGSDATVAEIAARVAPPRRLVAYGHRLSLAVLGDAATRGDALVRAADGLALDVALWDQLGCLSPVAIYVVSADATASDRVAAALASALEAAERRWPRGPLEPGAAARFTQERDAAELRAAAGHGVALHGGARFAVVCEADATPRPAPLHRFVRVHPLADRAELARVVGPLGAHLAGVAVAGLGEEGPAIARDLARAGASRICAPGQLQAPPLHWCHDGRGVLLPLAQFTDFEITLAP